MANRNSDLELALKIRTDLANTHAALHGTETGLEGVRDAAKDAKAALSGLGGDVKGVAAVGKAAEQAATGLQREAETADQAASRIKQMVQASLEYQRALEQQLASSEAASDATSRGAKATAEQAAAAREAVQAAYASQAATTAQIQSISELHSRVERGARSMEDLAETEQLLDRAIRGGLVSAAQLVAVQGDDLLLGIGLGDQASLQLHLDALLFQPDLAHRAVVGLAQPFQFRAGLGEVEQLGHIGCVAGLADVFQLLLQAGQLLGRLGQLNIRAFAFQPSQLQPHVDHFLGHLDALAFAVEQLRVVMRTKIVKAARIEKIGQQVAAS